MRKLRLQELEQTRAGDARCDTVTWTMIGMGTALSTSIIAAPLGIVIGGFGAALYFGGGCG
ncbi:hypothetical protein DSL64_03885 [Dyadobacter luteus]|uniref:Uncharacterized protein n=1 Tax=Dyadobacter luteus TaxID=2259619 RepID=A0A3D8YG25_9BACT|nr:hypothetical protein [Dyadobacter luteus]REA63593.1 hypothetical protein DSL64_03885 [Dyadobacter luteus]